MPGAEGADREREESHPLLLQPHLVVPQLPVVGGLEGIAGGDRAVLDMALLAGMNSDDVEAGVSAASPRV